MRVAQISDLHIMRDGKQAYGAFDTRACLDRAVDRLNRLAPRPDVVLVTGDLVDTGSAEEYARLRHALDRLTLPYRLIPGNHDARATLRAAFPEQRWDQAEPEFCQFVDETQGLRLIGLDSLDPGQVAGRLCPRRLAWLDAVLAAGDGRPTLIAVHHPAFATGVAHMDALPMHGAEALIDCVNRHRGVVRVVAGHVHRTMSAALGGVTFTTCPSTAHHFALDLTPDMPARWTREPPGFQLHVLTEGHRMVTHSALIEDHLATPARAPKPPG